MQVIEILKDNYSSVFDFKDDFILGGYQFDLYARYYQENVRYFGMKKFEIYSFSNNEHLFYKNLGDEKIDFEALKRFYSYVCSDFIQVDDKHMSSIVTVIYKVNHLDEESKRMIKKFSFYKSYLFGLKGYVNGKLIVLDALDRKACENKFAKGDAERLKLFPV